MIYTNTQNMLYTHNTHENIIPTTDWFNNFTYTTNLVMDKEFTFNVSGFSKDELKIYVENDFFYIKSKESKEIAGKKLNISYFKYIGDTDLYKEIEVSVKDGLAVVKLIEKEKNKVNITIK